MAGWRNCRRETEKATLAGGLDIRHKDRGLVSDNAEVVAAVLGPGGFVVTLHGGVFLAVADHFKLVGVHAHHDQVLIRSAGAALAKGEVVFLGAAIVAVAFDANAERRDIGLRSSPICLQLLCTVSHLRASYP